MGMGTKMSKVSIMEGIKFGFSLLLYILGIIIISGIPTAAGYYLIVIQGFTGPNLWVGYILVFVGAVIFFSGMMGIVYKVVADGVHEGVKKD